MISSVRGSVLTAVGATVVIDVGGVGLAVTVTPQHALTVSEGTETLVYTALIVREDDLALYGFRSPRELEVFNLLRGVTGVGPKSAMGVLAAMTPDEVAQGVAAEDDAAFRKVSGIGPKTAKLIILSLAGKIHPASPARVEESTLSGAAAPGVMAALTGLGWSERVAGEAVDAVSVGASKEDLESAQALLRLALAHLGPNRRREETRP